MGQAWLVILLALLYGGALAGVQTRLSPKIAENKKNETYSVIPALVRDTDKTKTVELVVEGEKFANTLSVRLLIPLLFFIFPASFLVRRPRLVTTRFFSAMLIFLSPQDCSGLL